MIGMGLGQLIVLRSELGAAGLGFTKLVFDGVFRCVQKLTTRFAVESARHFPRGFAHR